MTHIRGNVATDYHQIMLSLVVIHDLRRGWVSYATRPLERNGASLIYFYLGSSTATQFQFRLYTSSDRRLKVIVLR